MRPVPLPLSRGLRLTPAPPACRAGSLADRTFGFVNLPGCLLPELPSLQREHDDALATAYGDATPTSRETVRMLRPESPTFMQLPESCAAFSGGFGSVAEQLYGPVSTKPH